MTADRGSEDPSALLAELRAALRQVGERLDAVERQLDTIKHGRVTAAVPAVPPVAPAPEQAAQGARRGWLVLLLTVPLVVLALLVIGLMVQPTGGVSRPAAPPALPPHVRRQRPSRP